MAWHCSAQARQAFAQARQAAVSNFSHSAAQALQISTHSRHTLATQAESRASSVVQAWQMLTQSKHCRAQAAIAASPTQV